MPWTSDLWLTTRFRQRRLGVLGFLIRFLVCSSRQVFGGTLLDFSFDCFLVLRILPSASSLRRSFHRRFWASLMRSQCHAGLPTSLYAPGPRVFTPAVEHRAGSNGECRCIPAFDSSALLMFNRAVLQLGRSAN